MRVASRAPEPTGRPSVAGDSETERVARYEQLFQECFSDVYRYALSRSGSRGVAEETAEEVFAIAWRRLDDVPTQAKPWLIGVARRVVLAHRRKEERRSSLLRRNATSVQLKGCSSSVDERVAVALGALTPAERELVQLLYWDCLSQGRSRGSAGHLCQRSRGPCSPGP